MSKENTLRQKNINENEIKDKIESYSRKFFKKRLNIRPVLETHIIKF